jgi:alkylation response protein AidB-like acyl-CoA dehydrogenase
MRTSRSSASSARTAGWRSAGRKSTVGKGLKSSEQLVFFEEAQLAEVPLPFVTINTVAPALIALGSEEHKRFFLPKIAAARTALRDRLHRAGRRHRSRRR